MNIFHLVLLTACITGAIILYVCAKRIIKVLFLVPIACVPLSSIAGGRDTSRYAEGWIKEFLFTCGEVLMISMILIISVFVLQDGLLNGVFNVTSEATVYNVAMTSISIVLTFVIIASSVKGADTMLRKAFGS